MSPGRERDPVPGDAGRVALARTVRRARPSVDGDARLTGIVEDEVVAAGGDLDGGAQDPRPTPPVGWGRDVDAAAGGDRLEPPGRAGRRRRRRRVDGGRRVQIEGAERAREPRVEHASRASVVGRDPLEPRSVPAHAGGVDRQAHEREAREPGEPGGTSELCRAQLPLDSGAGSGAELVVEREQPAGGRGRQCRCERRIASGERRQRGDVRACGAVAGAPLVGESALPEQRHDVARVSAERPRELLLRVAAAPVDESLPAGERRSRRWGGARTGRRRRAADDGAGRGQGADQPHPHPRPRHVPAPGGTIARRPSSAASISARKARKRG